MRTFNKNQKIIFGVLLVFVFIASISLTYAYFSAGITGNENANNQVVTTGTLELTYQDGPQIALYNISPDTFITKEISVENVGSLDAFYQIGWKSLVNEIEEEELVISATCQNYVDDVLSGVCNGINEKAISSISGAIETEIGIAINTKHVYTVTIKLLETSSQQNYNQGKRFSGEINIAPSGGTYSLYGQVVDLHNNPVSGATVSLHSTPRETTTDTSGNFVFLNVEEGNHNITITNSSNSVVGDDDFKLITGSTLKYENKVITSSVSNRNINLKIKLGSNEKLEYKVLSSRWYENCEEDSNELNCKMISSETPMSDVSIDFSLPHGTLSSYCSVSESPLEEERYYNLSDEDCNQAVGTNVFLEETIDNGNGLLYTSDLSKTEDLNNDGTGEKVYYYRGNVNNNNVIFAGYCWKIVRTNEDGSIRLIYGGLASGNTCPSNNAVTSISSEKYMNLFNSVAAVGLMYGNNLDYPIPSSYSEVHSNINSSNMKIILESWFTGENSVANGAGSSSPDFSSLATKLSDYNSYLADTIFCNDRSIAKDAQGNLLGTGYGTTTTYFGAYERLLNIDNNVYDGSSPQFKCPQQNDAFTLRTSRGGTSGYGNNTLEYPVGLLTADELFYMGGSYRKNNVSSEMYLMSNSRVKNFLTLTPYSYIFKANNDYNPTDINYYTGYNTMFNLSTTLYSVNTIFTQQSKIGYSSVSPVVSLRKNITVSSGDGSYQTPYIIN